MEILGDFDDSIFSETKQKSSYGVHQEYCVRKCPPKWFDDSSIQEDDSMHTIHKYRGDLSFYEQRYTEALEHYDNCLGMLHVSNVPVWRDVQEARSRCFIHLEQKSEAVENARIMMEKCENFEQKITGLNLLCDVYRKFSCLQDEMTSIHGLITLLPTNPDLWIRLANLYLKIATLGNSDTQESNVGILSQDVLKVDETTTDISTRIEVITCLVRAKIILRSVNHTISSFAKIRNNELQEKVEKQLENLLVDEQTLEKCKQFLWREKYLEDEISAEDNQKLENLQRLTIQRFGEKWFSWHEENVES